MYQNRNQISAVYEELRPQMDEIAERFLHHLKAERQRRVQLGMRDPVEHCKWRVKSLQSIEGKLRDLQLPLDYASMTGEIYDVVGVRIVCRFYNDIYQLSQLIREFPGFAVEREKDYVKHPKPNGYRSYHMILRTDGEGDIRYLEVQLRTIAMDCWASLEHTLKYKKEIPHVDMIRGELKRCADEMAATDLSMQTIRDLLDGKQMG